MGVEGKNVLAITELAYRLHVPCVPACVDTYNQLHEYQEFTRTNFPRIAELLEQGERHYWKSKRRNMKERYCAWKERLYGWT